MSASLKHKRLCEILVELGAVGAYEAQAGIEHARLRGIPVGQALMELGLCAAWEIDRALAIQASNRGEVFLGNGPGLEHLVHGYFDLT